MIQIILRNLSSWYFYPSEILNEYFLKNPWSDSNRIIKRKPKELHTEKMKNLKSGQKVVLIITLLISLSLVLIYWYKQTYSLEKTHTYEVTSHNLDRKLLIATQGSPFKDSVTALISDRYHSMHVIVEVVDVKVLANINMDDFDAILLLYRWEANAPPVTVQNFMDKNSNLINKMVILTTSWYGLQKMKNIDAITGASIVENVPIVTEKISKRLDPLLKSVN